MSASLIGHVSQAPFGFVIGPVGIVAASVTLLYVERAIGSIRRELLDHAIVFGEGQLRCLLREYADYYNVYRTHLGLGKNTPLGRAKQAHGKIIPVPKLGGLHHAYVRM